MELDTRLHEAVKNHDHDAIRFLVSSNVALDERDETGWSPIFYAASLCDPKAVDILVENGCSLTLRDKDGLTPPKIAEMFGFNELGNFLTEASRNAEKNAQKK